MTVDARALLPVAERAVTIAADIVRTKAPEVVTAKGDRDMTSDVDFAVEEAVRDFLFRETPEIGFLGEEEGVARLGNGLMWALDPVDGTSNFLLGMPLCGVSLGLIEDDTSVLGVIDLPFLDTRYTAADGAGAHANGIEIRVSDVGELAAATVATGDYAVGDDADHYNALVHALNRELAAAVLRVRLFGSSAVNLAWVAAGKLDAAVMLGNNPWDMAAGSAIAREAGAAVVDIDNSPHRMNSRATIAVGPRIAADLLGLVAAAHRTIR